ncbi:protein of unknown function DUF633 [Desulfotomaculum nigrificans CO-1-SRB]|uniref:SAM-dependent methyltransferase n=1 Tax=Desulfotomaculum nigrificans (strain DSM 14880 / VKM B-2319 / CO-1-SRB) TaxID=868595 RepID=F6B8D1_DESCC|nr:class I SAM-dependent methyltransferase [Desulfotomaculum nigrificans]AEF94695.1 protein of unknown function DUF633 [Desulfotomaculum nigrificans CO-1-SRB]
MIKISDRLKLLAGYVPPGSIMADIGTDHGYLPVYLIQQGICPRAVAADINQGPLQAARANVTQHGVADLIDLRLGNGLQVLDPGEVDTIVIAGMGGGTIRDILSDAPAVATAARRLILQPMADEAELRQYLVQNGWTIVDEDMLLEDGRLYIIVVAERGAERMPAPILLELGPRLVEKKHPLLPELINRLTAKYEKVLTGLAKSSQPEAKEKADRIREKLVHLKEVGTCL